MTPYKPVASQRNIEDFLRSALAFQYRTAAGYVTRDFSVAFMSVTVGTALHVVIDICKFEYCIISVIDAGLLSFNSLYSILYLSNLRVLHRFLRTFLVKELFLFLIDLCAIDAIYFFSCLLSFKILYVILYVILFYRERFF